MQLRRIELMVVCTFLLLVIVEFIQLVVQIRIFGPNLLHPRIWQYIVILVIALGNPKILICKPMVIFYLYSLLYVMLGLAGHYVPDRYEVLGTSPLRLIPVAWAVIIVLRENYFRPERESDLKIILKVAWFGFILVCLTSLFVIIRNPGAVRGTEFTYFEEDQRSFRSMGLGGYGFFSALPFLLPVAYYFFKNSLTRDRRKTLLFIMLVALLVYTIYRSVILVPLLVAVFALLISVLGRKRFKTNMIILSFLLVVFLALPGYFVGQALHSVGDVVPNSDMRNKLYDMGDVYITGIEITQYEEGAGNTVEHRASRIMINVNQFLDNPLIGAGVAGNPHLYWLNVLAHFGLIGALPLFWLIFSLFKYINNFNEEFRFTYLIIIISYMVSLFFKAPGGYHFFLAVFFIAPGSYHLIHGFESNHMLTSRSVDPKAAGRLVNNTLTAGEV